MTDLTTNSWHAGVQAGFGDSRVQELDEVIREITSLRDLTENAETTVVFLAGLRERAQRKLRAMVERETGTWAFIRLRDDEGDTVEYAIDEVTAAAEDDYAAAVAYPETHMRAVGWFLAHAWRFVDLAEDAFTSLGRWRVTSAAVSARAVLEEVGCLLEEAREIAEAWAQVKKTGAGAQRATEVHKVMRPVLNKVDLSTRIAFDTKVQLPQARNVLTYVQKLAKRTRTAEVVTWYDWLSDAAHPAFGARIALATPFLAHKSSAVAVRYMARGPMHIAGADGRKSQDLDNTVAHMAADALALSVRVGASVLWQALAVVDDIGLTTAAATFTQRPYWRDFTPVKGNRPCPCGRGSWRTCGHHWGKPAPEITLP